MYVPPKHAVDEEAAWSIVEEAGAGMLVVAAPDGLQSVFVPVIVSDDRTKVLSHVAKANPWWRGVRDGDEVLGLFVVASAYVSPSNYPRRVEDAPVPYIERQGTAIVGLEIDVVAIQGKAKLSQNRPDVDHDAVRDNLAQGTPAERNVAARMTDDG